MQSPLGLHGVMTIASLVEKETAVPAERPLVAGVFLRRLEKGWALQCDPTVIYAIRLKYHLMGRPSPPLTLGDLNLESPYNTYQYRGLPPGPIMMPSINAPTGPSLSSEGSVTEKTLMPITS